MSSPWSWQQGPPSYLCHWRHDQPRLVGYDPLMSYPVPKAMTLTMSHVRRATRALRWNHPGIAANIFFPPFINLAYFKAIEGRLVYRTAADEEKVNEWLDEGVRDKSSLLSAADGNLDRALDVLKQEICVAYPGRSKWMFKVNYIGNVAVNKHAVMIRTGHTILDGIGTFEALDLWMHELANIMSQPKQQYAWGKEGVQLDKPVPDRVEQWNSPAAPAENPVLKEMAEMLKAPPVRSLPQCRLARVSKKLTSCQVQFGIPLMHPNATPTSTGTFIRTFPGQARDGNGPVQSGPVQNGSSFFRNSGSRF